MLFKQSLSVFLLLIPTWSWPLTKYKSIYISQRFPGTSFAWVSSLLLNQPFCNLINSAGFQAALLLLERFVFNDFLFPFKASERIFCRLPSACIEESDRSTPKLSLDVIVIRVAGCLRCFCSNGRDEGWERSWSLVAGVYLLIRAVTLSASAAPLSSKRLCHLSLCCLPKPCAHKHTWLNTSHWILIMAPVIFLGNYLPGLPLVVLAVKPEWEWSAASFCLVLFNIPQSHSSPCCCHFGADQFR